MNKTYRLVMISLFTALVTVTTMVFQVPVPVTRGYINLGDTMVLVSALLFGPMYGAIAGGLGSALADLFSPYAVWAPFTLVIKGLEGFIAGYIYFRLFSQKKSIKARIISMVPAVLWMVAGYFAAEMVLYSAAAAFVELPGNLFQAAGSVIIGFPVVTIMSGIVSKIDHL